MKYTKEEAIENILTRREAENFLNLSNVALQYHLRKGNIIPTKTVGAGRGSVQLFWKNDLIKFKEGGNMDNKTWNFQNYTVEDTSSGFYEFTFRDDDSEVLGVIVVDEESDYNEMVKALNNGADPISEGWEDGGGNTLNINGWGGSPAE